MNLIEAYRNIRAQSLKICEPLQIEDYVVQPALVASPPKWHLAHITWFFETFILKPYLKEYPVFNEHYGYLFNSYYETAGDRILRAKRGLLSRPTVQEIRAYRKHVDHYMEIFLNNENLAKDIQDLVVIGLNHEQQHQELLYMDIKYILGNNPLFPAYTEKPLLNPETHSKSQTTITIESGNYEIGYQGDGFCYDNEKAKHQVYLETYQIHPNLVTNGEYLKFIEAGGYHDFHFWHSDGWTWLHQDNIIAPKYWHLIEGQWYEYTLAGLHPLNLDAPVCHTSFYEASAYAEWLGKRLPTEAEWEVASDKFIWGICWEWTESAYLPYPRYQKPAGAIGEYNAKFMVNQKVLRGACVATPKNHSRKTYRNFFFPFDRWQFSGIRLVEK